MTAIIGSGAGALTATRMVTLRGLRNYRRTPQILGFGIAQALAFLLIFRYVFGGAIVTGGARYVDFMLPGLLTAGTLFSGMGTAVAVAQDRADGFFDRLRSLPMPRGAVVTGRVLADTALVAAVVPATAAIGFLVGFRVHNGWWSALAAYALLVLFGFAFLWVFLTIGLLAANAQAAQGITFLVLPVSFASGAYVPVASMPGWLRVFAEHQPVTVMVDAVRALTQGGGAGDEVTRALLWCAAIVALCAPLAAARFRRAD